MRRVRFWTLIVLLLYTSVSLVCAEEAVDESAKISIWYPDDWGMESDEDSLMIVDPSGEVIFIYILVASDKMEDALEVLKKELLSMVSDLQSVGEPEEDDLNGMECIFMEAQGKIDGVGVDIGIIMVITPADKVLLVMGIVESAKYEKHEETIAEIIMGIQPL